jgi:hypothetical protein
LPFGGQRVCGQHTAAPALLHLCHRLAAPMPGAASWRSPSLPVAARQADQPWRASQIGFAAATPKVQQAVGRLTNGASTPCTNTTDDPTAQWRAAPRAGLRCRDVGSWHRRSSGHHGHSLDHLTLPTFVQAMGGSEPAQEPIL